MYIYIYQYLTGLYHSYTMGYSPGLATLRLRPTRARRLALPGDGQDVKIGCFLRYQSQWEFQDPKMEVLYHIRPYFWGIFPYIGLT